MAFVKTIKSKENKELLIAFPNSNKGIEIIDKIQDIILQNSGTTLKDETFSGTIAITANFPTEEDRQNAIKALNKIS